MRRLGLLCCLLVWFAAGCGDQLIAFEASIVPSRGNVPFEATIKAHLPSQHYVYHLPNGTVETDEPQVTVTVDSLEWEASVDCLYHGETLTDTVTARGTNPRADILAPTINGNENLWFLQPFMRTLIQANVSYSGAWELLHIEVTGSTYPGPYSTFYPPYERGVRHAYWQGHTWDHAAVVYPLYMSKESPNGLPYARSGFDTGYPHSYQSTNVYSFGGPSDEGQEIPEQDGIITVTVVDDWGRTTAETFSIPILAADYLGQSP